MMAPNLYHGTSADHQAIAFRRCTRGLHLSGCDSAYTC